MGTHPIFESDFDCLTECYLVESLEQHWAEFLFDVDLAANMMHTMRLPFQKHMMAHFKDSLTTKQPRFFPQLNNSLPHWSQNKLLRSVLVNLELMFKPVSQNTFNWFKSLTVMNLKFVFTQLEFVQLWDFLKIIN